jgi:hypothetical protein
MPPSKVKKNIHISGILKFSGMLYFTIYTGTGVYFEPDIQQDIWYLAF